MLKKLTFVCLLLSVTSHANARGVDLKLANSIAELTYLTESSTFGYGGADIGLSFMFTEDDDYQFSGQFMVSGNPAGNNRAFQFGVGGKLMMASIDIANEEIGALALGGQFRYVIPAATPVAFVASAYFAPSITSFSGADQYNEYSVAAELEVTPSARAYVGYRKMEYDFESGGSYELDDHLHVGIKFDF